MTNSVQHLGRISRMRLRAASAALTLAFVLVFMVVTTQSAEAQTFTVLHNFTGSPDGAYPMAGLVRDATGNLYGTSEQGGTSNWGTVFTVDASGTETVLFDFNYANGSGAGPLAGLVRDTAGNLYGTTSYGGSSGNGLVFKVDTSDKEAVLHNFAGGTRDGCAPPNGFLVRDTAGNLYGTTLACGALGYGTVFKLSKSGKETVLHSFAGGTGDGCNPYAGLVRDAAGNLYGTTQACGALGYGTVFKLSKSGKETVLHNFDYTHGALPYASLVRDAAGNLYGTTVGGGVSGAGTVFKLSKSGKETVLHSFAGGTGDGCAPLFAGLVRDKAGNLYGTTDGCGASAYGTVFKLSKSGTETLLHSFAGGTGDGCNPYAGLVRDAAGNLYGTTQYCGSSAYGTVWKLTP